MSIAAEVGEAPERATEGDAIMSDPLIFRDDIERAGWFAVFAATLASLDADQTAHSCQEVSEAWADDTVRASRKRSPEQPRVDSLANVLASTSSADALFPQAGIDLDASGPRVDWRVEFCGERERFTTLAKAVLGPSAWDDLDDYVTPSETLDACLAAVGPRVDVEALHAILRTEEAAADPTKTSGPRRGEAAERARRLRAALGDTTSNPTDEMASDAGAIRVCPDYGKDDEGLAPGEYAVAHGHLAGPAPDRASATKALVGYLWSEGHAIEDDCIEPVFFRWPPADPGCTDRALWANFNAAKAKAVSATQLERKPSGGAPTGPEWPGEVGGVVGPKRGTDDVVVEILTEDEGFVMVTVMRLEDDEWGNSSEDPDARVAIVALDDLRHVLGGPCIQGSADAGAGWSVGDWYLTPKGYRGVVVHLLGNSELYGCEEPEWFRTEYGHGDACCAPLSELRRVEGPQGSADAVAWDGSAANWKERALMARRAHTETVAKLATFVGEVESGLDAADLDPIGMSAFDRIREAIAAANGASEDDPGKISQSVKDRFSY